MRIFNYLLIAKYFIEVLMESVLKMGKIKMNMNAKKIKITIRAISYIAVVIIQLYMM